MASFQQRLDLNEPERQAGVVATVAGPAHRFSRKRA
jgi:hypothetical protein